MEKTDKLELGAGARLAEGYLHQDVTNLENVKLDFVCNAWEVPLSENSLSEVLALGMMEHLRFKEFGKTLAHIYKLLKKGGCFLFDVPDMKVWSEYLHNVTHGHPEKNPCTAEHVWSTMYGWQRWPGDEHKSGWTKDSVIKALKENKFMKIEEGVTVFTSKGIERNRFKRSWDAHVYIKAIK